MLVVRTDIAFDVIPAIVPAVLGHATPSADVKEYSKALQEVIKRCELSALPHLL